MKVHLNFPINYSFKLSVQLVRFLRGAAGLKSHSSLDISNFLATA